MDKSWLKIAVFAVVAVVVLIGAKSFCTKAGDSLDAEKMREESERLAAAQERKLQEELIDAAKEVRSYTFGRIQYNGWQLVTAWFDEQRGWPNGHISGPDNGQLDFPVRLYALVVDGVPDGQPSSGVVYLDELTATDQAIPESTPTPPRSGTRSAQLPGPPTVGQTVGIGALLGCGLLLGVVLVTDWPEHVQGRIKRLFSSYRIPSRRRPGPIGPTGGRGCAC